VIMQNSIRHNLSLGKCFRKIPRAQGDPGKVQLLFLDNDFVGMAASRLD